VYSRSRRNLALQVLPSVPNRPLRGRRGRIGTPMQHYCMAVANTKTLPVCVSPNLVGTAVAPIMRRMIVRQGRKITASMHPAAPTTKTGIRWAFLGVSESSSTGAWHDGHTTVDNNPTNVHFSWRSVPRVLPAVVSSSAHGHFRELLVQLQPFSQALSSRRVHGVHRHLLANGSASF